MLSTCSGGPRLDDELLFDGAALLVAEGGADGCCWPDPTDHNDHSVLLEFMDCCEDDCGRRLFLR